MIPPAKPFSTYKWRWAVLTPTEGLNEPPIFLGVLRALRQHEGQPASSPSILSALARVGTETRDRVRTAVHLDRDTARNLLRNSQQYWRALGLLETTRGGIALTDLGRRVADGAVTKEEFAALEVKTLTLPNPRIQTDTSAWENVGLSLKPLELIIKILTRLSSVFGPQQAFITPNELIRVVIPLAGTAAPMDEYLDCLRDFRAGTLDLGAWPDCAPESNDRRMAKEFLLFLDHYDFLRRVAGPSVYEDRYELVSAQTPDAKTLTRLTVEETDLNAALKKLRAGGASAFAGRRRILAEILARPEQARFRKEVLAAYQYRCLLTGERISDVLQAAHIIPVRHNGSDAVGNGFCFRSDVHDLFDAGHIRISASGVTTYSEAVQASVSYQGLPNRVDLPNFVLSAAIVWRWRYQ